MNPRFLAIAQDPSIIHGVHHYCDVWCDIPAGTADVGGHDGISSKKSPA